MTLNSADVHDLDTVLVGFQAKVVNLFIYMTKRCIIQVKSSSKISLRQVYVHIRMYIMISLRNYLEFMT